MEVDVPISLSGDSAMAHGDHNPKHGGFVYMQGDLHYEVVLTAEGRHHLYLSDAVRIELPAAMARDVVMTVRRPGEEPERLELGLDEFGESWLVQGRPITDEATTVVLSFTFQDEPFEIELPFVSEEPMGDPHQSMGEPPPAQ